MNTQRNPPIFNPDHATNPDGVNPKIKIAKGVTLSVATKIIISTTLLLLLLGSFLDVSTIILLREDKKNYTFQSQSTETLLTGKSLVSSFQNSIDLLKLSLSLINPTRKLTESELSSLQAVTNRQHSLIGMRMFSYENKSEKITALSETWNTNEEDKFSIKKENLFVSDQMIKNNLRDLIKNGYQFLNISSPERPNVIAILTTDVDPSKKSDVVPVAIGFISIDSIKKTNKSSNLTVLAENGTYLFDSDSTDGSKLSNSNQLFLISRDNNAPNGTTEYTEDKVDYLGTFNKPGLSLTVLAKIPVNKAMRTTYVLTEKFILLGLMIIGVGIILSFILSNSITAPLSVLYEATKEIAKGNFSPKLYVNSKDEIGSLATSFISMCDQISNLILQKVKSIHLEKEVEIASAVQQTLIPDQSFENKNIEIYSHYQSANECGGDLWNLFEHNNKTYLMIADATGHGIPSALITASARSCFSVVEQLIQSDKVTDFTPADVLKIANKVIQDASKGKIYMTMFVSIVDFNQNVIIYSNAGHNAPWLFSPTGKMATLHIPSSRLGENLDSKFENREMSFESGDTFFLYTDGLIEGTNSNEDQFGKKSVKRIIEKQIMNVEVENKEPKQIVSALVNSFMNFNGDKPLDDDVTIVVAKLKGGSHE